MAHQPLPSSRHSYGSVQGPTGSRSYPGLSDASNNALPDSPFQRSNRPAAAAGRGGRWLALATLGGLAVLAVMAATARNSSGLPEISTAGTDNLVEVSSAGAGTEQQEAHPVQGKKMDWSAEGGGGWQQEETPDYAPLAFTAVNFYHVRDGKPAQDYLWLKNVKLIEPYRETTLAVADPREGFEYEWEVRAGSHASGDLVATATGAETVVVFKVLDACLITLKEVDAADGTNVVRRMEETAMVKYVRREIRTLTDEEREELLDAMFQLWSVRMDSGNGHDLYGTHYADIWAINRMHFKAASPEECDHFHDGLGFLTSHALLTNTFEYSLQLVNPKLTVPYWDFTIESIEWSDGQGENGERVSEDYVQRIQSPVLTSSWFGTTDPVDSMVKDGRWAYTEIPRMKSNNPGGVNADVYGKLRAPWNVNDRAYLTRGMGEMCGAHMSDSYPWPTCETHYDLLTSYTDFYSWVWDSLYDPHGPVHVWIGGVLDCEDTYEKIKNILGDGDLASKIAQYAFVHRKNMYRDGVFKCEGGAGVQDKPGDVLTDRTCGCLDFDLTQGNDYEYVFNEMFMMSKLLAGYDDDTKRLVTETLCSGVVNDGDHLQASSSLDPTFWPTHPTMERLWMFSVLTGRIKEFTWPDTDVTYVAEDGSLVTEATSLYAESCMGHRGSDVFPFGLLSTDDDGFTIKTGIRDNPEIGNKLSNREVLQAFDPRANALTYVYDTFEWAHCEADGYNFDDAWMMHDANGRPLGGGGERTVFEEGQPRFPMYRSLKNRMAEMKQ